MRIVVAMSGGVDSSAAACLLKEQGHDVIGLFMRNGVHSEREGGKGCCTIEDSRDAQLVASHLGIPFYAVNFEHEFGKLIDYFIDEYNQGRTPNPCVMCNRMLKFGHLLNFARELDAEAVATGHYARLEEQDGRKVIRRGVDFDKDQSYVLFNLTQAQLSAVSLPIGDLRKGEVRELAKRAGLHLHSKHESQDICFVPDGDYRKVLKERAPDSFSAGLIVDENGNELGRHEGIQLYTIGQRKGLGVAVGEPRYVTRLNVLTNTVHIGPEEELYTKHFTVSRTNWVTIEQPDAPQRCAVQIRYHHDPADATIEVTGKSSARITFDEPQKSVTPGQAAVFYHGDYILGGGWIDGMRDT